MFTDVLDTPIAELAMRKKVNLCQDLFNSLAL